MLKTDRQVPRFALPGLDGVVRRFPGEDATGPMLLVFVAADCPACRLSIPYLNRLVEALRGSDGGVWAIFQDGESAARQAAEELQMASVVLLDQRLVVSRQFDPLAVPAFFLVDRDQNVVRAELGFDKATLNSLAEELCRLAGVEAVVVADPYDGQPAAKPGCGSRHLEASAVGEAAAPQDLHSRRGQRASREEIDDDADAYEFCMQHGFADPLPVLPPTLERVERMLTATNLDPEEIVAFVPPCYGPATVEKIAANAVMAGCPCEMMPVLIPLVRAACDERLNLHGVQATTHFAAPLVIVNGPVRRRLGFACGQNVFSNVARANSTLGRALQLVLLNLGGARPDAIDMSTLGSPGKFSYCIAENEEESPWQPLHVDRGLSTEQSAVTLFAAEPPRAVSEHVSRTARGVLQAISAALATVWNYRVCVAQQAVVVLGPEHVKTIARDGFSKRDVREFLFTHTGIPLRAFLDGEPGEGSRYTEHYEQVTIDGEACYRKFATADSIYLVVAGGTAGKFSAVLGGWGSGSSGSQMVTYPID